MNKKLGHVALILALTINPGWAEAFRAFNRQEVVTAGSDVFEVIGRVGASPADYWCGAGDYARRVKNAGATTRIYLWRAVGPSQSQPGKKSVLFSFTPPQGANTTPRFSLSVNEVGDNLTTNSARQYCYDRIKFESP